MSRVFVLFLSRKTSFRTFPRTSFSKPFSRWRWVRENFQEVRHNVDRRNGGHKLPTPAPCLGCIRHTRLLAQSFGTWRLVALGIGCSFPSIHHSCNQKHLIRVVKSPWKISRLHYTSSVILSSAHTHGSLKPRI
jgi:hypothetical protein